MSHFTRLSTWNQQVSSAFTHLSKAQALGLALWSAGMALTGCCGIVQISALLAAVLDQRELSVFQRLREWYLDAPQKSGKHRDDLDMTTCFGPLLRWIVRIWDDPSEHRQVALAMDATSLGNRWTVLAISVVLRGCAIPVAWKVLRMHEPGSWEPYWKALLMHLKESIPSEWRVIVLTDRGLYARWLFEAICQCHWHPFMRINLGVKARQQGTAAFEWIGTWVHAPGQHWAGPVECFIQKRSRLTCTLLMDWEEGYEQCWAVITDLAMQEASIAWYGMRTWVEGGFKDLKRGGFDWQYSRMERASQVERIWLAMAVALVWMISVGSQAEGQWQDRGLEHLPERHVARRKRKRAAQQAAPRKLSCPTRGKLLLYAALLKGEELMMGRLVAEPWPSTVTRNTRPANPRRQKEREKRRRHKQVQRATKHRQKVA
jgi:hypothetical protein